MKIVFLDIDGVLNGTIHMQGVKIEALLEKSDAEIDPDCIQNLNAILQRTGASIVLSTSWRVLGSVQTIEAVLRRRGLWSQAQIIAKTPNLRFPERIRGDEIRAWLEGACVPVESYVILDDDDDMGTLAPRLVRTDHLVGLTTGDVETAVALLEKPL